MKPADARRAAFGQAPGGTAVVESTERAPAALRDVAWWRERMRFTDATAVPEPAAPTHVAAPTHAAAAAVEATAAVEVAAPGASRESALGRPRSNARRLMNVRLFDTKTS